jgi:hypothetical protein
MATTLDDDIVITGSLTIRGAYPPIARSALTQETYSAFDVPVTDMRVWDAFQTPIATAATDDLGLTAGAFATGTPYVTAGSLGSAGATTRYARFLFQVPMNYVAGQLARFAFLAGITGGTPAAASVSCTLDLECYKVGTGTLVTGSDLVSSSATDMNFTTFVSVPLDLTATSLSPGDVLDCRIAIACNDAVASAANCVPAIQKLQFQASTKG